MLDKIVLIDILYRIDNDIGIDISAFLILSLSDFTIFTRKERGTKQEIQITYMFVEGSLGNTKT